MSTTTASHKPVNPISQELRKAKTAPYSPESAIERYINEIAEVYGMSKEEVCKLAIIKLEQERIKKEENDGKN